MKRNIIFLILGMGLGIIAHLYTDHLKSQVSHKQHTLITWDSSGLSIYKITPLKK